MIEIVKADGKAERQLIQKLKERSGEVDRTVTAAVSELLEDIKKNGDEAVRRYTEKFDGSCPEQFEVPAEELERAVKDCDPDFVAALEKAAFKGDVLAEEVVAGDGEGYAKDWDVNGEKVRLCVQKR